MAFDSSDSRRAAEFDTFRRELVMHSKTVSGEAREAWFEKLKALSKRCSLVRRPIFANQDWLPGSILLKSHFLAKTSSILLTSAPSLTTTGGH